MNNRFNALIAEQKLNRSRINPHFLNNAFTGIQAMALEPDSEEKLISFTRGVSRYSRLLLESTLHEDWSIAHEYELLQNFTSIYVQKFKDRYQVQIEKPTFDLKEAPIQIPTAITQTLIENAFQHSAKEYGIGQIIIRIFMHETKYVFEIINSIGESQLKNKREDDGNSQGLKILKKRLELYNIRHKKNTQLIQVNENECFISRMEFY